MPRARLPLPAAEALPFAEGPGLLPPGLARHRAPDGGGARPGGAAPRRPRRIAVVGGGLSGALAVIALADAVKGPLEIVLFAAETPLGGGLAYGHARPSDLLNVRARDLSVHPAAPEDFAEWLSERAGVPLDTPAYAALSESFAPRTVFGDYVRQRLEEAIRRAPLLRFSVDRREVVAVRSRRPGLYEVACATGEPMTAGVVILATGYGRARPRFGLSPYDPELPARIARARHVTIAGSGLSMVDVLLAARREGWDGTADIVSRHGLLPLSHAPVSIRPPAIRTAPGTTVLALVQRLRAAAAIAAREGRPWQGEVNRLRPHAQEIWRTLSPAEQSRFLRHARRLWDVHRHRIPAPVHAALMAELAEPRTRLVRGHVRDVAGGGPFTVAITAGDAVHRVSSDLVVDCTGFRPDTAAPVVASLLSGGLAERDPLGIGLAVAADGRIVPGGARGEPDLFALGPLGQGSLFEITAAPEIIAQTRSAAETIRELLALDRAFAAAAAGSA